MASSSKKSSLENSMNFGNMECSICLETMQLPIYLISDVTPRENSSKKECWKNECQHMICTNCRESLTKAGDNTCPICRRIFVGWGENNLAAELYVLWKSASRERDLWKEKLA